MELQNLNNKSLLAPETTDVLPSMVIMWWFYTIVKSNGNKKDGGKMIIFKYTLILIQYINFSFFF